MTVNANVSGTWKQVPEMHTKVSGVWKAITEGYVNVSGTWKQFFSADSVYIPHLAVYGLTIGSDCTVAITFGSNGALTSTGELSGEPDALSWWTGNPDAAIGAAYELRITVTSGAFSSGTTGSWVALSASPGYTKTQILPGNSTVVFTVEIRRASDSVVMLTKTGCSIQAEAAAF